MSRAPVALLYLFKMPPLAKLLLLPANLLGPLYVILLLLRVVVAPLLGSQSMLTLDPQHVLPAGDMEERN